MTPPSDQNGPPPRLAQAIDGLSEMPGVYIMKDADGQVIYIGKAINLRRRVSSYFQRPETHTAKTAVMVSRVADIESVVTASEKEALILESTLIKRHRPRFNVVLKDDKRYPSIRINVNATYPKIEIVRKTPKDGAVYFGPFASAHAVRQTVKMINKTFPLRKCSDRSMGQRTRPCIHHQMGQCLAPCCLDVDPIDYKAIVKEVTLFLKGRTPELIKRVRRQMLKASETLDFEKAAALRDRMQALEKTLERQVTVTTDFLDRDVIGFSGNAEYKIVTVMTLRRGFLQGIRNVELIHVPDAPGDLVSQFMGQYYQEAHDIPIEVLVPALPDDVTILQDTLSDWKRRRVSIRQPIRGEKRRLLEMAETNAANTLREKIQKASQDTDILEGLKRRLVMDRLPKRIECFDNSNLGGTNPVAAMVVFESGRPHKSGYRRFSIRTVASPDDYATMAEVLSRRYQKINPANPKPDLLLVDGGKGQLGIAVSVLDELGLAGQFSVAGIAKKDVQRGETEDKIYVPNRANPVNLGRDGRLLLLLQQIRDEAHRFAITFQRKRRGRAMVDSVLDRISGVGPKRKALLLKRFGGIKQIRAATVEELSELPGVTPSLARAIQLSLAKMSDSGSS